jgi:peptide/nickel transport system substrate-binding protein
MLQFGVVISLTSSSMSEEWKIRKPRGTLKVMDLFDPSPSAVVNYAEPLITLDKDNNWVPCLAEDWRWKDERTIEFKLRESVKFHNGEEFDAEVVQINWREYQKMTSPRPLRFTVLPDEAVLETIDRYTVRFTLPEPDGLALVKFLWFFQIAPSFFTQCKFENMNWGYLSVAGPWGTGPFKLVEGSSRYGRPSDQVVLEAYERYWDRRFPMLKRVIFKNNLLGDREEAIRLCRDEEGFVDIVSFLRPLDTLRVAESVFAKVVKCKDITLLYALFNQRQRDSEWKDIRLRKAVNHAINREELLRYAARGNAYNLGGFLPAGAYGHNPDLNIYTYDTSKARKLLVEAGYPNGFEVKMITVEPWKLESQIISKMLERIGLKVQLEVLAHPQFFKKLYRPLLDKRPEEQDWDICIWHIYDVYGHPAVFLAVSYTEESDFRWTEYDPEYEKMWREMARTPDRKAQEERLRNMVRYIYDRSHSSFIYCPLSLYAVNKEVDFVPQKRKLLRLKETSVTENHWSIRGQNN